MASPNAANKLAWVEMGRGLAAVMVLFVHMSNGTHPPQYSGAPTLPELFWWGFLGVDFFFVLSGFIILYVHWNDIGRPDRAVRYGWRRVVRIFPTYWIVFALALTVNLLLRRDKYDASLDSILRNLLLWTDTDLLIGPAWTLRYELMFYFLFSTLLINRRFGLAVLGLWFSAVVGNSLLNGTLKAEDVRLLPELFLHPYNLNFALGMALAYMFRKNLPLWPAMALCGAGGAVYFWYAFDIGFYGILDQYPFARFFGVGLVCAALMAGLLALTRTGIAAPGWVLFLGNISFSLYLSHLLFGASTLALLSMLGIYPLLPDPLPFLIACSVAIIASWVMYRYVETPILAWGRTKFEGSGRTASQAA